MNIRNSLGDISETTENTLKKAVINYALKTYETDEDTRQFFKELLEQGCQSGIITNLIQYKDTHAFCDKYYCEIENIRLKLMETGVLSKFPESDLKTYLAYVAFEEMAQEVFYEAMSKTKNKVNGIIEAV